jgi:hypothetical protein
VELDPDVVVLVSAVLEDRTWTVPDLHRKPQPRRERIASQVLELADDDMFHREGKLLYQRAFAAGPALM